MTKLDANKLFTWMQGNGFWYWNRSELNSTEPEILNGLFNAVGEMAAEEKNTVQLFSRLCESLSPEAVEGALKQKWGEDYDRHKGTLETLVTKYQLRQTKEISQASWVWAQVTQTWVITLIFFETVVTAFGMASAFALSDWEWQDAASDLLKPLDNIYSLSRVTEIFFDNELQAKRIAAYVSVAIAVISLLYPFIKPYPPRFHHAQNWTQMLDRLDKPIGRDVEVHSLVETLRTHQRAMIIGKTGVGKTETVKAFTHAIQEDPQYDDFKDKQVVYVSMPELVSNSWSERLYKLVGEVGNHSKNTILVFDEIHIACEKEHKLVAERLKTLVEDPKWGISYAIGITTEEEYARYIYHNNPAFARRFETLPLCPTSPEITALILTSYLEGHGKNLILDKGLIDYILSQCPEGCSQPYTALGILAECINASKSIPISEAKKQLENLRKKETVEHNTILCECSDEIPALQKRDFESAENNLAAAEQKNAAFLEARQQFVQMRQMMMQSAQKCMLIQAYLLSHLREKYENLGNEINTNTHLSKDLVDRVVTRQKAYRRKAEGLMRDGSSDKNAREVAAGLDEKS